MGVSGPGARPCDNSIQATPKAHISVSALASGTALSLSLIDDMDKDLVIGAVPGAMDETAPVGVTGDDGLEIIDSGASQLAGNSVMVIERRRLFRSPAPSL